MRLFTTVWMMCLSTLALADSPLTAKEFRKIVQGKTFDFAVGGQLYGREYYIPGDRVIWDDLSGNACRFGSWYQQQDQICFAYDDTPDFPRCWAVLPEIAGVHVLYFENDRVNGGPYLMTPGTDDIICTGPEVGA